MEKIDTDQKQRNLTEIQAKLFESFNREVTPLTRQCPIDTSY